MTLEATSGRPDGEVRHLVTASIAVRLRYDAKSNGLLLVASNGQWGLPAGGLKANEYLTEGIRRELKEETGIDEDKIFFLRTAPSHIICLPGAARTQLGLVFDAVYHGPRLNRSGWVVDDDKVDLAKPFSMKQLVRLLRKYIVSSNSLSGVVYKPQFNLPILLSYVVEYGQQSAYVREFLAEMSQLDNLEFNAKRGQWEYHTQVLEGRQNDQAVNRKYGLRWGP